MKKIALLGAGFIASVHMEAWKNIEGAKVVAFFEVNNVKASEFQKKYSLPHYNSLSQLFSEQEVDAVDICLPTFLHREYTEMAALEKKHVFCEKPIALSLEDAFAMQKVCEDNGVFLMIGHVLRFWGEYVKARELVASGAIGQPILINAFRLSVTPVWSVNSWILKSHLSGGASLDLHIHDLDFVNWLAGNPQEVFARGLFREDSLDHVVTTVKYGNGVVASIEGGWMMQGDFPFTCGFRILGSEGVLEWTFRAGVNIEERAQSSPLFLYRRGEQRKLVEVAAEDPYREELAYFLKCIEKDTPPGLGTPEQAIEALRLALAAKSSVIEGERVLLEEL
ncbi:Gfo/Idh/MocA family oxidoreductase [Thermatribacter velox]|uniref:Gfo/Idh/MocA family oxidoreductase n=1 Tax=Thermatribacter velox TaxID=3039681 RepID=A0ABZ2YCC4_9BACT